MDGLLKNYQKKRENTIYLWSAVYQQTNKYEIYLHAADVNYHRSGAVVTIIITIPYRWLDISITNMNTSTGPVQVF